jgi:transposase-like protein
VTTATPPQVNVEGASELRCRESVAMERRNGVEVFFRQFPTEDACLEFVKEALWPQGITRCAKCGRQRKHHRVKSRKAYACNRCGNHIYPLRGTVFTKSSTPLQKWFYAMYLMASTKQAVTAKRIQREIGVTYKTAWRICRQLRVAIDSCERQHAAHAMERVLAISAAIEERMPSAASPEARVSTHPLLSQEVTCREGITFISNFLPGYLRMCRDV